MMSSGTYAPVSGNEEEDAAAHSLHLQQSLIVGPGQSHALPAVTSVPLVEVVSPADLPEGYEFQAMIGGRVAPIKVPPGGVEQGQKFQVPFPEQLNTAISGASIPVGHWRDSLVGIFSYGVCHPHCWTGCFCHLLAAGQVIARLKLTACGRPGNPAQVAMAFKVIFFAVALYFALYVALSFALIALAPGIDNPYKPVSQAYLTVALIRDRFHYIYWITTTVVLTNLRRFVRQKYAIPPNLSGTGGDLEDCCCSCWCPCLVSSQMLRHTTDYDVYPATCCTERGIPPHAPSIV